MSSKVRFSSPAHSALVAASVCLAGCATAPTYFPTAPTETLVLPDGRIERAYDTDGDGIADQVERLAPDGRVDLLRFDTDGDGQLDSEVNWPVCNQRTASDATCPHLVIILDSVPYEMVHQAYLHGRFRLFAPPGRSVATFPVMTDLCLDDLFHRSPSNAVETEYYDGRRLVDGWSAYSRAANSAWLGDVDVFSPYDAHARIYTHANQAFDEELANIERSFMQHPDADMVGYVVASSALGAAEGRDGHASGLVRLDRFCQSLVHRCRGRLNITLLSDHGHYFTTAKVIDMYAALRKLGYQVTDRLRGPKDVVVAAFGMVTCASLYTNSPLIVACDLTGIEGVELTAVHRPDGDVEVWSRDSAARIRCRDGRYRYQCEYGDPLQMKPILEELKAHGAMDTDGFVGDEALFEATQDHIYPDAMARLYYAFNGLVDHTPDVLVSFSEGHFWGSPFMSAFYELLGTHGNLNLPGSSGFVMTTVGELPPVMRIGDVGDALERIGAPIRSRNQTQAEPDTTAE